MLKSELIKKLAERLRIPESLAELFLNTFIKLIYESLSKGEEVNISGFGKFKVSHRLARIGVNPRNPSQKITIPELNTPKFISGEAFKEAVKIKK